MPSDNVSCLWVTLVLVFCCAIVSSCLCDFVPLCHCAIVSIVKLCYCPIKPMFVETRYYPLITHRIYGLTLVLGFEPSHPLLWDEPFWQISIRATMLDKLIVDVFVPQCWTSLDLCHNVGQIDCWSIRATTHQLMWARLYGEALTLLEWKVGACSLKFLFLCINTLLLTA